MTELFVLKTLEDLEAVASNLLCKFPGTRIFALHGQMGAGKTTLIKALCHELGVMNIVNSPTYAVINVYARKNGEQVYHFDMYRLKNQAEALAIGSIDYFESGEYCFIEWPELVEEFLPDGTIHLEITGDEQTGVRQIYLRNS
jgi:tRNA threonylcarbamoyladenosine biosynthesis protein TsaE